MTKRTASARLQRGFSLLTGFILAIIMFGSLAFFLAGQGINAGFGATYTNTSKVSALLTSAGYINTGFDSVILGGTGPSSVTFDTTAKTGIFNPSSGGASPQALDPSLFNRTTGVDGYWIYRSNALSLKDVGGTGSSAGDFTIIVSGLKQSICEQINDTLHGIAVTGTGVNIPALTSADAALLGTPTTTSTTQATPVTSLTTQSTSGWLNGCYLSGTANNYVYIHTLLAQ